MGVFNEAMGGYSSESLKTPERCKRDYEKEISNLKKSQVISRDLAVSIKNYVSLFGKGEKQFSLNSLYGALLLELDDIDRLIAHLQEEWEQEK